MNYRGHVILVDPVKEAYSTLFHWQAKGPLYNYQSSKIFYRSDDAVASAKSCIDGRIQWPLGLRVLVHQVVDRLDISQTVEKGFAGIKTILHACSDPSMHWESRIVGWSEHHGCPQIATRCRGERGNPNHAEWPYGGTSLKPITDGEDWTSTSCYKVGDEVRIKLDQSAPGGGEYEGRKIHHVGDVVDARLEAPHIEPGDWYLSFLVPDGSWRFKRVVHESVFE